MKSGRDVNVHGSDFKAAKNLGVKAKRNVNVTAEVTHHERTTKSGNVFSRKKKTERWSTVDGSAFEAGDGLSVIAEEGGISMEGADVTAGGKAAFRAKKGVQFRALKTTRSTTEEKSSWFGFCRSSNTSTSEELHGGKINVGSLEVVSETGDIDFVGADTKVKGAAYMEAEQGSVKINDIILRRTEAKSEAGLTFGEGGLGYSVSNSNSSWSERAGTGMQAGQLVIKAKKDFVVDNGYDVDIAGDMMVDAKTVLFKGAELDSSSNSKYAT